MSSSEDSARVLVIYVGGTIGMLDSDAGYVPHSGFLASNLRSQSRFHDPEQDSVFAHSSSVKAFAKWSLATKGGSGTTTPITEDDATSKILVKTEKGDQYLPSLVTPRSAQGKRIHYAILEYEVLIDSAEVELSDWVRIASDIELNYHLFDSFVILHGTDTMAYTASALSFLLEDLGKTVIITGAQIPLSELFNDSIENLLGALIIAGHYTVPEVCLFFNHKLLRGNRAIKASSDEFDAFASPSLPPLASVGIDIEVLWAEVLRPGPRPFRAHKLLNPNVATLRIFPGISGKSVRAFLSAGDVQGVVLESYGAGNAPRREELLSAFREAAERGVVIVNVSQCATGSVAPDIYETGRALAAVGIIGGADMTVECALAKLSYLLSKSDLSPAQVRKLIAEPLRGELTRVSPVTAFSSPSDRLQTLFSQVVQCSSVAPRSLTNRSRTLSAANRPGELLPAEFASSTSDRDADVAEKVLLPFLLGQAASRPGSLLATLLSSQPASIALINESSTPSSQTPLHLAVLTAQLHNVVLLLANGASVHSRDILSHTALFYAARLGGPGLEMVKALRGAGAHLGETEIERGNVGLEILRAEMSNEASSWMEAAGEDLERAKLSARNIVRP